MSDSQYKVVVKSNVTVQVEVQRFSGGHTMDEISKVASEEAHKIVQQMVNESGVKSQIVVHHDVDVFSILVKGVKP